MDKLKEKVKNFPEVAGVYLFKSQKGDVLYIGKAGNLKKRVQSYFSSRDRKVKSILDNAKEIDFIETQTVIEALLKEAELIKEHKPPYNIRENDDRSFLYVVVTKDNYPRVLTVRGKDLQKEKTRSIFGPFVFASEIREAMKIIRKIFPYSTHSEKEMNKGSFCFYYQIGLCPGNCGKEIDRKEYLKNIKNIELFFKGEKKRIISSLKREMKRESDNLNFEKAKEIKRKIDALTFIQDTAVIQKRRKKGIRIEGYDISHTSGDLSVGAMVVFSGEVPQKEDYRLFKIKGDNKIDDTGMLREVLERRLKHSWKMPNLIVVDGGEGQVSAVKRALKKKDIPVVGIAKGEDRKGERIIGSVPKNVSKETLLQVQREAHRFSINYHRKLRDKKFL